MKTKTLVIAFILVAAVGVTGYRFMVRYQRISAAANAVNNAKLQEGQQHYNTAAEYWQKAAALLPEESKKERSLYLYEAGYDLYRIAKYKEALPLYKQSLGISREIGDKKQEGVTLDNIGQIYKEQGDYSTALKYLEQSIVIRRGIGDRQGEGAMLNGIGLIYFALGDYTAALKYLEQSLGLFREIGDKMHEGGSLSNIAMAAYFAKGDSAAALKYLEQSLVIRREIGDKAGEAVTNEDIGRMYEKQGDLRAAEQHMSRAVQLAEEIGHPKLEYIRTALEDIRAKLRGK